MNEIQKQIEWVNSGMPSTGVIDRDIKTGELVRTMEKMLTVVRQAQVLVDADYCNDRMEQPALEAALAALVLEELDHG